MIGVASKNCEKNKLFWIEQLLVAQPANKSLILYGAIKNYSRILGLQSAESSPEIQFLQHSVNIRAR
jgi:hypothetical protein